MSSAELSLRASLGVPPEAKYVMIVDSSAHLDYDWLISFPEYYNVGYTRWQGLAAVKSIYAAALPLLQQNSAYCYSVCEMDFLRQYLTDHPDQVPAFAAVAGQLALSGGGLTSPDNLLSHGEAFIRNYLTGKLWLAQTLPELLPIRYAFLPDDFGHDPELPATLQALGVVATAFQRAPGTATEAPTPALVEAMYAQGIDFFWQASDGSTVLAHFLQGGYGQGSDIDSNAGPLANIASYFASYSSFNGVSQPFGARTPYLYVPSANDFSMPVTDVPSDANSWNTSSTPPYGYANTGVWVVAGTFATFVQLVLGQAGTLTTTAWDGRPYWTGHYMSRVALKILHYGATRGLLAAEALGLMAAPGGELDANFNAAVRQAWFDLSPSTHHDFVNGTAVDTVYTGEQLPMLTASAATAQTLCDQALNALAGSVSANPNTGETPFVAANALGLAYAGIAELPNTALGDVTSVRFGNSYLPAQASAGGGVLFVATLPSLGYTTGYLTNESAQPAGPLSLAGDGTGYTFSNAYVTATIAQSANWGITAFTDADGNSVLAADGVGNQIVVFQDNGDIYEFGYEYTVAGLSQYNVFEPLSPVSVLPGEATITETGPLRVTLTAPLSLNLPNGFGTFDATIEYSLTVGEPFLRMSVTGAAPSGTSVLVTFPFAAEIDGLINGTPNHWTAAQQQNVSGWNDPIFRPTHRFVLPQSGGETLAAIYHPEVPAWAFAGNTLYGCVLRNTPNGPHGASGSDSASHTLRYALRGPAGLGDPSTGSPLFESTAYASPPFARAIEASTGALGEIGSVAAIVEGTGVIQAAKAGDVATGTTVLRVYQPSNAPQTLTVWLPATPAAVQAVTALEDPIETGGPVATPQSNGFTVEMANALATVQITW